MPRPGRLACGRDRGKEDWPNEKRNGRAEKGRCGSRSAHFLKAADATSLFWGPSWPFSSSRVSLCCRSGGSRRRRKQPSSLRIRATSASVKNNPYDFENKPPEIKSGRRPAGGHLINGRNRKRRISSVAKADFACLQMSELNLRPLRCICEMTARGFARRGPGRRSSLRGF
jgi:hypothetical protein